MDCERWTTGGCRPGDVVRLPWEGFRIGNSSDWSEFLFDSEEATLEGVVDAGEVAVEAAVAEAGEGDEADFLDLFPPPLNNVPSEGMGSKTRRGREAMDL